MPHLEDVKDRIDNIGQIEGVVVAMRAMAVAHAQDARKHLEAIRAHEETVARALADALALLPGTAPAASPLPRGPVTHLLVVVGAAQGFSGLYNESIVSGVLDEEDGGERRQFLLIGQRCITEFEERGAVPVWSANMVAHADEVPALASRVVDALFERFERRAVQRVSIVHADPDEAHGALTRHPLMPFDFSGIQRSKRRSAPLTLMPPHLLLARLVEEYVFTEICEALMLGFAAENDARMEAMTRARSNVKRIGEDLKRTYNQARQEETTTEIIELSGASSQGSGQG